MTDAKKIGDAKLAQKVIEAYASGLDALNDKECANLGIDTSHCSALQKALGKGAEGIVTGAERAELEKSGFSNEFVSNLAGVDGKKALHERVKWLADKVVRDLRWRHSDEGDLLKEIGSLGVSGAPVVLALVEALKAKDNYVRSRAAWVLDTIGPSAAPALPALIEAMRDEECKFCSYRQEEATVALIKIGAPAVPALIKARNEDYKMLTRVPVVLAKIGAPAVPALIEALKNTDWTLRSMAANVLGRIGPAAAPAVPALIAALKDEDEFVPHFAAIALGWIGPDAAPAVPALIKALKDRELAMRSDAAMALGRIGPSAAPAVPALIAAMKEDREMARSALITLSNIGPPAFPALFAMLKHKDHDVRESARDELIMIGASAVPSLASALADRDINARTLAAEALGKIGKPAHHALPFLERMAEDDPDLRCKQMAGWAVEKILKDVK